MWCCGTAICGMWATARCALPEWMLSVEFLEAGRYPSRVASEEVVERDRRPRAAIESSCCGFDFLFCGISGAMFVVGTKRQWKRRKKAGNYRMA